MTSVSVRRAAQLSVAAVLGIMLGACSMTGGGGGALSPGLTARMDQPNATLNRSDALGIINQYRVSSGAVPLVEDESLNAAAQTLVSQYMETGNPPRQPSGTVMRTSAGYSTFAETFSGWRNSAPDAAALREPSVRKAGIATRYSANSGYGVYWVLLLAP